VVNLVIDEVDHVWGLGLGLGRCELRERSVWPRGVEMVQVVRTCRKWRLLTIRIRSSNSRRSVPIIRSQIAFARGARGGLVKDPAAVCGEDRVEILWCTGSPVPGAGTSGWWSIAKVHQQVASGLGGPCTARVRAHTDQKRSAGAVFDLDQCVDSQNLIRARVGRPRRR
jgi:hypothetical protein